MSRSSRGAHVIVGPQVEDGVYKTLRFDPNGIVREGTGFTDDAARRHRIRDSADLEPCPGAGDSHVFHEMEHGTGPAMVNSPAYCEGWERTFGQKNNKGGAN